MIYLSVKDQLIREIGKSFDPKLSFDKRIRVMSDLLMFKAKEDISVWKQKRGELPEYFTVYFDNEYICGFDANQPLEKATLYFWKGFKEAYKKNKIRLTPKAEIKEVKKEKRKATTPVEKMATQIVEKLNAK